LISATSAEVNFDGLPGPTHNYSGLATGNLASERNKSLVANPRRAALQGLAKMKALADRGFLQAVLPPHERPDLAALRALGFAGNDNALLAAAARDCSLRAPPPLRCGSPTRRR
jgi:succinylarginine dihydrolase